MFGDDRIKITKPKTAKKTCLEPFFLEEEGSGDVLQPLIPPTTPPCEAIIVMGASGPGSDQPNHTIASPLLTVRRPSDELDPRPELRSGDEKSSENAAEDKDIDGCDDDEDGSGAGAGNGLSVVEDDSLLPGEGDGEKRGSLYRLHKLHLNNLLAAAQQQQQQNALFASPWAMAAGIRAPSSHRGSATLYVPTVPPSPGSSVHFFIGTNPTGSLASVMTAGGPPGSLTPFAPYYFQPVLLKDKYAHYYRQQQFNNLLAASKGLGGGGPEGSCASFLVSESGAVVLCRICQTPGTDATLISPCKCAGSVRYVHKNCLTKWLEINPNRNRKSQMCELCQYTYHRKKKFKFKDWKWPHCSSHDKLFHALFIIAVLVMMGCASAFIVCFRKDRGVHRNEELELSEGEIVTLSCGVLFFLSFFLGMYAEIKAHNPIYKICSQTISMNRSWIIDEYVDNGGDDGLGGRRKTRPKARPRPKNFKKGAASPLSASTYNVAAPGIDEECIMGGVGGGDIMITPPSVENSLGAMSGGGGGGGGYMGMIDVLPTITEQQVVMVVPAQPVVSPADSDRLEPISVHGQAKAGAAPTLATFLKNYNHIRACSYTQDDSRDGKDGLRSIGAPKSRPVPATPALLTRHASLPTGGGVWGQDPNVLSRQLNFR